MSQNREKRILELELKNIWKPLQRAQFEIAIHEPLEEIKDRYGDYIAGFAYFLLRNNVKVYDKKFSEAKDLILEYFKEYIQEYSEETGEDILEELYQKYIDILESEEEKEEKPVQPEKTGKIEAVKYMEYLRSVVNRIEEMYSRKQEGLLRALVQKIIAGKTTGVEYIISHLIVKAINERSMLNKVIHVGEALNLLPPEELRRLFPEEKIRRMRRYYILALSIKNAQEAVDRLTGQKYYIVSLPVRDDELPAYFDFLRYAEDTFRYILRVQPRNLLERQEVEEMLNTQGLYRFMRELMYRGLDEHTFTTLKNLFLSVALPEVYSVIRVIVRNYRIIRRIVEEKLGGGIHVSSPEE